MTKVQNRAKLVKRLAKIQGAPREAIHDALKQGAEEVTAMQKRLAPRKSGDLRNSIGYTFGTYRPENSNVRGMTIALDGGDPDLTVTIHAGDAKAFYAAFVEFGTSAHEIKPKRPGGLLNVYGRLLTSVSHPGATPQPFFFPGWRATRRRVKARISRATTKSVRKAAGQ